MCFSDSTQNDIPKPNKHTNYDSSPFNSDDTLSDDTTPLEDLSLSLPNQPSNPNFQHNSSSINSVFQTELQTN